MICLSVDLLIHKTTKCCEKEKNLQFVSLYRSIHIHLQHITLIKTDFVNHDEHVTILTAYHFQLVRLTYTFFSCPCFIDSSDTDSLENVCVCLQYSNLLVSQVAAHYLSKFKEIGTGFHRLVQCWRLCKD